MSALPCFHSRLLLEQALRSVSDYRQGVYSLDVEQQTQAHMLAQRLTVGEQFWISFADQNAVLFEVVESAKRRGIPARVRICRTEQIQSRHTLTLIQGISATDRMDTTIRQVTELGVSTIIPLSSQRSIIRLDDQRKHARTERWQRISISAAEQSGQLTVPDIHEPIGLEQTLALLSGYDVLICCWEETGGLSIRDALKQSLTDGASPKVALFIGPEGGFSVSEVDCMRQHGAIVATLGNTILRTETAAVVASALVLYELGHLGNGG